jgi:hypothetical protein
MILSVSLKHIYLKNFTQVTLENMWFLQVELKMMRVWLNRVLISSGMIAIYCLHRNYKSSSIAVLFHMDVHQVYRYDNHL